VHADILLVVCWERDKEAGFNRSVILYKVKEKIMLGSRF